MSTDGLIAVTGATGGLGGRVARRLAGRGVAQRLVVRDAARAPQLDGAEVAVATYGDGEAMRRALDGVATLLLVPASEAADRVKLHTTAVDAAVRPGSSGSCTPRSSGPPRTSPSPSGGTTGTPSRPWRLPACGPRSCATTSTSTSCRSWPGPTG